ncbi:MAG: Ig-like domain-containing protein [Prevotella sp.]|nr:Ig-like domain-containing protein [Prevotella sp.]
MAATAGSAQEIVKGDMNGDNEISVVDVTNLVEVALGRLPKQTISLGGDPYKVNNALVIGTWYAPDGWSFTLSDDGTTDYPGAASYEFMPMTGRLLLLNAQKRPVKVLPLIKVESEYLLTVDYATGAFTYYTKSTSLASGITLDQTSLTINSGTTAQLTATISPEDAFATIIWTSSDESVATVDANGLVSAVAGGTCTITAKTSGSNKTATCSVSVTQMVTEITLPSTSLLMEYGSAQRLTANVLPETAANKSVKWSSSDENIVELGSNGLITAVGYGICTVTCTATDGSGVSATCEITVPLYVSSITLSENSLTIAKGGSQSLTATVAPADATTSTVTWSSSDESIATVSQSGQVTGVSPGNCTITCSSTDGSNVTATCEVTVWTLVLSASVLPLELEGYQKLTASSFPAGITLPSLSWSSSNENVAEVTKSGLVSAVNYGTCIITCEAADDNSISATCKVNVNKMEYVDLGLPSGTLWATCNIGATSPEEYGDYFAWGETMGFKDGKTTFDWSTYKWCEGSDNTLTKYCTQSNYGNNGFTDNKTKLELEDDAAYVNWGPDWRMPTTEQLGELFRSTTVTYTSLNGITGRLIVSKSNGNSIFLPEAGYRYNNRIAEKNYRGLYWSCELYTSYPLKAYYQYFDSGTYFVEWDGYGDGRCNGRSIRPVRSTE